MYGGVDDDDDDGRGAKVKTGVVAQRGAMDFEKHDSSIFLALVKLHCLTIHVILVVQYLL